MKIPIKKLDIYKTSKFTEASYCLSFINLIIDSSTVFFQLIHY